MSRTSSGILDQRNYKRATIDNVFASTPIDKAPVRFHSISSLSRIDTTSSSNEGRTKGRLQSQTAKQQKTTKRRKADLKNKSQLDKKRRKVNQSNDTKRLSSSQWETELEESIVELITNLSASTLEENDDACINLFDDPSTPEKIRNAPIVHEPLHYSPILGFRRSRRSHLISKESNIVQRDKLLPINIPSSEARSPNETDEDEIILKRTSEVKTYPAHRVRFAKNSSLRENSLETYFNFSYPPEYYTTILTMKSDLLWEKFVEENRDEFPYLASSSARKPVETYESEFLRKFPDIPPKFLFHQEDVPIPSGMICIHGYSDRTLQKWITYVESNEEHDVRQTKADKKGKRKRKERTLPVWDKTDVYHPLNETVDVEFETGGKDGRRIPFSEFRQNQKRKRMMNTVSGKLSSIFSSSQTQ